MDRAQHHLWIVEQLHRPEGTPAVGVLRWPADRAEAQRLAAAGQPRLLLLGLGVEPLRGADELEDWLRLPVTDEDFVARLRSLQRRAAAQRACPRLDGTGRLLFEGRSVVLSATEERLVAALIGRIGGVVGSAELIRHGWGDQMPSRDAWRAAIFRLRHRCQAVGLEVISVRARGYALRIPALDVRTIAANSP